MILFVDKHNITSLLSLVIDTARAISKHFLTLINKRKFIYFIFTKLLDNFFDYVYLIKALIVIILHHKKKHLFGIISILFHK